MKLSVSLPEEDVRLLDEHVRAAGLQGRSAALHEAIQLLRYSKLEEDYADAWSEWESSDDAAAWDSATGDGVS
jgi:Arc/MetJ-type ribon-helix-helix transcriptional regulator